MSRRSDRRRFVVVDFAAPRLRRSRRPLVTLTLVVCVLAAAVLAVTQLLLR